MHFGVFKLIYFVVERPQQSSERCTKMDTWITVIFNLLAHEIKTTKKILDESESNQKHL